LKGQSNKRILFISEGQLGDILILTPVIKAVKESIESVFISILLVHRKNYTSTADIGNALIRNSEFRGTAEVFLNNPYIDEILEVDRTALRSLKGMKKIKAEWKNIRILRKKKFDIAIATFGLDRYTIYAYLSGAKMRIGQKEQPFGFLLNHKLDINSESLGVLNYFCALAEPLGVNCNEKQGVFNISESGKNKAEEFFSSQGLNTSKPVIGIHPGSSENSRKWPPSSFAGLMNSLKQENKYRVIMFGSEFDNSFVSEINKGLRQEILQVQTRSLDELAALMARCDICITHNSGPRHLAAAVGTRTLGILEKVDDLKWQVYDTVNHPIIKSKIPCKTCPEDKCLGVIPEGETYSSICLRDISVADVLAEVRKAVKE